MTQRTMKWLMYSNIPEGNVYKHDLPNDDMARWFKQQLRKCQKDSLFKAWYSEIIEWVAYLNIIQRMKEWFVNSNMIRHFMLFHINGAGTFNPSGAHECTPCCFVVCMLLKLVMYCRPMFVFLSLSLGHYIDIVCPSLINNFWCVASANPFGTC
jgi:hypothetical protein